MDQRGTDRRPASLFIDALGDGRDDSGRAGDRLRIGAMIGAVALTLAITAGVAVWPALHSPARPARPPAVASVGSTKAVTPPPASGASQPAGTSAQPAGAPPQAAAPPGAPGQPPGQAAAPPGNAAPAAPAPALMAAAPATPAPAPTTPATAAPATVAPLVAAPAIPTVGFSFEDGGTDGWGGHGHVTSLGSGTVAHDGTHSLEAVLHSTGPSDLPYVSVSVSGSSAPAAGQTLTAFVFVSGGSPGVQGKLFVQDTSSQWHTASLAGLTRGGWTELSLRVPSGIKVEQLGVQFLCSPVNQNATLFVDSVSWS